MTADKNGGNTVTFLDTADEFYTCIRVLVLSVGVGAICWILMLLFVILLSQKAIRPIAENIEKQKQFVTNAGHEIKTPLAIIQSNADALELYQGQNKWTSNIKQQTVRLNGLMKNLLLLAKMDENNIVRNTTCISLSDVVKDMVDSFTEPMQMRGTKIQSEIQSEILIDADREQITQLFSILFDNVRKYASENSTVEVMLKSEDKCTVFQIKNVCDMLPPVPPEQLFERFYRADEARTQKNGGYGIGLSVAQGIVKQ